MDPLFLEETINDAMLSFSSFNKAAVGIALLDGQGRLIRINEALCRFCGYTEAEITGKSFQEMAPPDELRINLQEYQRWFSEKRSTYQVEIRFLHKKGHPVWAQCTVSMVRDRSGRPLCSIAHVLDITERKHAEELYELISENAQEIISYSTPDGITRFISPAVKQLLGYEPEEVIGTSTYSFWHPEDMEKLACAGILRNSDIDMFENRVRHKNGHYVWFETTVKNIRNEYGIVEKVLGVGRDITERKKTDEELRKTKNRLLSYVQNSADAIWVIGPSGIVLEINPAFEDMFFWRAEEILGKTVPVVPDFMAEECREVHQRVKAGESVIGYETVLKRKDGKLIDVSVTISPILDDRGNIVALAETCRDISVRKHAEKELKSAKDHLDSFINNHVDPILLFDDRDRLTRVNPAFEETYGWTALEMLGLRLDELPHVPEECRPESNEFQAIKSGQSIRGYESIRKRKDGTTLNVLLSGFPMRDEEGRIKGWSLTLRDISDRKQAEAMLVQSEKLSVAGHLAAGIAHEIRNPVTAIKGFVQLMKPGSADKRKYFDIISSEIDRIEMILSELLVLAKPQSIRYERKELASILAHVVALLDAQAIMNNVEIITEYDTTAAQIQCDENQLKQVFINFIKNAIEAMPGGGKLLIRLRQGEGGRLLVSFTDQGCGIPKHILSQLGQPFYTTKEKGTGLGFMVSKRIIENHNGTVYVSSEENKGTVVEVALPLVRCEGISPAIS